VSAEIGKLVTSTLDLNTIFARTVNLIIETGLVSITPPSSSQKRPASMLS
jgi:hypothetical protein